MASRVAGSTTRLALDPGQPLAAVGHAADEAEQRRGRGGEPEGDDQWAVEPGGGRHRPATGDESRSGGETGTDDPLRPALEALRRQRPGGAQCRRRDVQEDE